MRSISWGLSEDVQLASFLPPLRTEYHVFRASLVLVVVTLAVGQSPSLLCKILCEPDAAAASGCHHGDSGGNTSPGIATDTGCDTAPGPSAFLKSEAPRTASGPDGDLSTEVPVYRFASSMIATRRAHEPDRVWCLDTRPLVTALRI